MSQEGKILLLPAADQAVLPSHCSVLCPLGSSLPGLFNSFRTRLILQRGVPLGQPRGITGPATYYLTEPSLSSGVNRFPGDSGCSGFYRLVPSV